MTTVSEILDFGSELSLDRMKIHSQNDSIKLNLEKSKPTKALEWSTGVLWGKDEFRGLLITHFNVQDIVSINKALFGESIGTSTELHVQDFMKEYCNLYAGFIKGLFNNNGMEFYISLPFASDEISAQACLGLPRELSGTREWSLDFGKSSIFHEAHISMDDSIDLNAISFLNKDSIEDSNSFQDVELF